MSPSLEGIALTLNEVAAPGMKPKELLKAVRDKHPEASKKDVVRAAFYSVIAHAGEDAGRTERLHDFAIQSRAGGDAGETPGERKRKPQPRRRSKG